MKTSLFYSLGLILALAAMSSSATGASMRCGTHLVQGGGRHGPTMYEVLKKCGEPRERHAYIWVYKRHGAVKRLHFSSDGILRRIERVD